MSEAIQEFNWQKIINFGKVVHIIIDDHNEKKTACGHDVTEYTTKSSSLGKKCGLCMNIKKQWGDSNFKHNRFTNSYKPSDIIMSGRYS